MKSVLSRSTLLAGVLQKWIDDDAIVGGVLLLAEGGELTGCAVAGLADREAGLPMQRKTVMRYASMTKLIVSALALKFCEEGVFSLGAPVTNWLPLFKPRLGDGRVPEITIRHLLSHTAGLSYGFEQDPKNRYEMAGVSDGLDSAGITLEENLRRLASIPLFFPPGSAWQYSIATDVLGGAIQMAGQKGLPELLGTKIFSPLQMLTTGFGYPHGRPAAPAYWHLEGKTVRISGADWYSINDGRCRISEEQAIPPKGYFSAGADLAGSADDYMRFLLCLRENGKGILSERSVREMLSSATGSLQIPSRGPGWSFGLGPLILVDPVTAGSRQGRGTWSWCGVHGGHYWVDPQNDLILVALTNTGVTGAWGAFADELLEAIYR